MNHKTCKLTRFFRQLIVAVTLFSGISSCNFAAPENTYNELLAEVSEKFAPDKRVAVLNFQVEKNEQGILVLKGETNLPEAHNFLLDTLAKTAVQCIDSIRVLPSGQLGENTWGLVTLSVIPMRKTPSYSAEMVSQTIMGTPVKLLDKKHGWYLIQTPDQYLGWVYSSGIVSLNQAELDNWKSSERYIFTLISGAAVEMPKTNAPVISDLVLGNIFEAEQLSKEFLKVKLPDGRQGFVKTADCIALDQWENQTPTAAAVIKTAKTMLGSPYLWGGTSSKGIDCSGFTKTAYFSQGIMLARDASQQARYGQQLDISNFNFQPGDLLFFGRSKDRITHVGLYIGNDQFIHSSGRVRINSFNPEDENYEPNRKKTLVAACRIINSINSGQIIAIKNHPWYN